MVNLLPAVDRARLEALWKQEGASRGAYLRKPTWPLSWSKSTKLLKMQRKRNCCATLRNLPSSTHNLKVIGSNPIPATKITPSSQRLGGVWLFCDYVWNRLQEALWKQEGA
jgi:hypothetical protein